MMKRTVYEAPVTERFSVELEGSLMAASIMEENEHQDGVSSSAQELQELSANDGFVGTGSGDQFTITWE